MITFITIKIIPISAQSLNIPMSSANIDEEESTDESTREKENVSLLKQFEGKVISEDRLPDYIAALKHDLVECDLDKVKNLFDNNRNASGEVVHIPFSTVHVNTINTELSEEVNNKIILVRRPAIDLLGFIFKCPVVIRIENWMPEFACRVPTCVTPSLSPLPLPMRKWYPMPRYP